jgi:hypothetical protein
MIYNMDARLLHPWNVAANQLTQPGESAVDPMIHQEIGTFSSTVPSTEPTFACSDSEPNPSEEVASKDGADNV